MPDLLITVTLRETSKPGAIRAHCDVRVESAGSTVEIFGISVVQPTDSQKPVFLSYPQRPGRDSKRYFPVVRVTGALDRKISDAVLREWERVCASAKESGATREPEEEVPF